MGTRFKTGTVANLPFDPNTKDVRLHRSSNESWDDIQCNITQDLVHQAPGGFAWNVHGPGATDLALNILHKFLPPTGDGDIRCHDGSKVSVEAWFLHQDFKRAFIAPLPSLGGVIKGEEIQRWIDENLPAARRAAAFEANGDEE